MNRRFYLVLLCLLSLASLIGAEESLPRGILLGGRAELERNRNGGGGEFGIILSGSSPIRSQCILQVSGYGTPVDGMGELALKLTMGGVSENRYHTYGFLRGGMGFLGDSRLAWDLSGGGGFELFISSHQSFVVEMGGGSNWVSSPFESREGYGGYAFVSPGFRYYF